ncbi:MAG: hypothetical protein KUG74_13880 [Rhodobacteraceae bacterium]|nr:hypothetical protein [Paracoccaceae bacterium]
MNKRLHIVPFLLLAACVEPSPPEMSLGAAETFCAPRAQSYARRPLPVLVGGTIQVGLLAEMPDDFMVQDFYRRCVYSKSGQRASGRVEWRL